MADAKGVQKIVEEYLVGTVGIVYAAVATVFLTLKNPARMNSRNRAGKENAITVLPASVAMLLFMFPIVFFMPDERGSDPTSVHELLNKLQLSGLTWYAKLVAITILFIVCDCLVRLVSWFLSRDDRRYYRNCERLRYAVAAFAATGNGLILLGFALRDPVGATSKNSVQVSLVFLTLFFVGAYPAALVLNSLIRTRFGVHRFSKKAITFASSWIFSWLSAAIAFVMFSGCWGLISDAIRAPEKKKLSAVIAQLRCLLTPEGQIAVSALIQNNGDLPFFFAPDEFVLTLSHPDPKYDPAHPLKYFNLRPYDPSGFDTGREEFAKYRLRTESNFATLLNPAEEKVWTFTVVPTVTPAWPVRSTEACLLERDNSVVEEYRQTGRLGAAQTPGFPLKSAPVAVRCIRHDAYSTSDARAADVCQ